MKKYKVGIITEDLVNSFITGGLRWTTPRWLLWRGASGAATDNGVYYSGIACRVDEMVTGMFEIDRTKGQVYGRCVKAILTDMIQKIKDSEHQLTIRIEDTYEALKIAILASNKIHL